MLKHFTEKNLRRLGVSGDECFGAKQLPLEDVNQFVEVKTLVPTPFLP
jgi:hypothetical protein